MRYKKKNEGKMTSWNWIWSIKRKNAKEKENELKEKKDCRLKLNDGEQFVD